MGADMKSFIFSVIAAALTMASAAVNAQSDLAASIARGEYLARTANCAVCHSLPEGEVMAGGLEMATPLGNIYATNITPDKETGIGDYTLEDFDRAVRLGVARDGHLLYPAMPYPSYAKISQDDIKALTNIS